MQLDQLPRDDSGIVTGLWKLRHRSADFTADLGPLAFRDGVTVEPLGGLVLVRMMVALGDAVDAEPWDGAQPAQPVTRSSSAEPGVPTTAAELMELSEERLRALAAERGLRDGRVRVPRLRRYLADELGIEGVP